MSNREQFIAKMRADGCPDTWTFQDDGTGGFHNHATEWAWIAWNRAIESQAAQIAALKTVMIAAAEEIAAHWQAHCDAEGYGPQNLLRRLEEGIPSEYGYTAGAFAALTAERDALRAALSNPPKHKFWGAGEPDCPGDLKASNGELHTLRCKVCGVTSPRDVVCLTAIDAARTQAHKEPT